MTRPKIGSIIKYPYWESHKKWYVMEYNELLKADYHDEGYINAVQIGGNSRVDVLAVYTGDKNISANSRYSALYWEYVE